ncbi:Uma2 family endonuclease [Thiothrix nivea]|uniref:Putative restriction endonuclease domain-containing protein n=1 Tax=Thiothrix nivea (strain ATCC 35100 / DSM 5205 / JP2) TaxID=870187 RepID=A0A656HCM6_THINJ|nr:Uma2 family endonuclease [Thiothrix nivea]EIJ34167.1 protein of unknown function DUF820 [Thiothrix nivea DSM 5205]
MSVPAKKLSISPAKYLAGEMNASFRSEYVLGEVYAMADASDAHVTINANLITLIKPHLRGSGCKAYQNDMKVRIGEDEVFYYPDLLVSCDPADHKRNYVKQSPLLIIEILSGSTEAYDRGDKFAFYRQLDSLQEYVLISAKTHRVEVFRRNAQNRWELFNFAGEEAEVEFASINLHCRMRDVYEDVDFGLA